MITGEVGSIYPKEAGDTFDAQKDQIGTGPWELDHWTPSVELAYKHNANYWGTGGLFRPRGLPGPTGLFDPAGAVHHREVVDRSRNA